MRIPTIALVIAGLAAVAGPDLILATSGDPVASGQKDGPARRGSRVRARSFHRVGTFADYRNRPSAAEETVSEIIAATADGRLLIYTDGANGSIGFIDITDPSRPQPAGTVAVDTDPGDAIDAEPTSVDVLGNQYALVAVNTSASLTDTSGHVAVVDIAGRTIVAQIPLGGQPDSIKISPDGTLAAVAIENERNEDLCVGGAADGLEVDEEDCVAGGGVPGGLPQTPFGNPPGHLAVLALEGAPSSWAPSTVDLTGLSAYGPEDPEPEFVDINHRNEAVVTLQENNHIVIVDLQSRAIVDDFDAGTATVDGIDGTEDGVISLTDRLDGVPRQPDGVTWIPGWWARDRVATANEGDLFGGSRGFSIFERDGGLAFDSGRSLEVTAVRHGHYPEARSENAGTEPEAIEYGRFGHDRYLFVGSERGGFIAVYDLPAFGPPRFRQLLPAPLEPEGVLAIPERNLLIASGEADDPTFGVRSTVMIYQLRGGPAPYPQIVSADDDGSPIPWSALSGMTAIPWDSRLLLAVWDSFYSASNIFRIDVSRRPAVISASMTIRGGSGNYDPEGIAIAPDHTLWIASEGNASDSRPNRLLQVDFHGNVLKEIGLPDEILACRAASTQRGTLGSGFEGVAVLRSPWSRGRYRLIVAQQRGWDYTTPECEDLDDDAGGLNSNGEPNLTRLWIYDPRDQSWSHVAWQLAPKPANASWVGLSEITALPDGFVLIERDNRTGDFGELKTLVKVARSAADEGLVSQDEKAVFDLRPALVATNGWITDKPEGVAVTPDGRTYVVTDNDGVDDWSGETWFLDLGRVWRLFRPDPRTTRRSLFNEPGSDLNRRSASFGSSGR